MVYFKEVYMNEDRKLFITISNTYYKDSPTSTPVEGSLLADW